MSDAAHPSSTNAHTLSSSATDAPVLDEARLRADLTVAIKAKDAVTVSTLRLALSAISTAQAAGKTAKTLTPDEVEAVIRAERKRRLDAAESFDAVGRTDRADVERTEAAVLEHYLPAPLSEAEIAALVDAAIAELDAPSPAQMGAVVKAVRAQAGSRADGATVARLAKDRLTATG